MVKKGIDLLVLSPSRWANRDWWQDSAMACDACSLAGRKLCVVCKFRSATMQELWESYGRVYKRKDEEQL